MKKILIGIVVIIILAGIAGIYFYNKPTESIRNMKAESSLTADSLFAAFENDEVTANKLFSNKVVEVSGKIQSVDSDTSGISVTLQSGSGMFGVICKLEDRDHDPAAFTIGQTVQLKGFCTGYLMDVVMVRCIIEE